MRQLDLTKCWAGGVAPGKELDAAELEEHGALVAFQMKVCRVLEAWLPLAPLFRQRKPGVCVYEDKKTIAGEIATALQAVGISMVVGIHSAARKSATPHSVLFQPFTFTVSVAEAPVTNRGARGSGVTCSRCGELVLLALSGLPLANGTCELSNVQSGGDDERGLQLMTLAFQTALAVLPPEGLLQEELD